MKRIALAFALLPLAACSGGGSSSTTPGTPVGNPTSVPQSQYVRPKITFTLPKKSHLHGKGGKYISPSAQSVTITLTATNVPGVSVPISATTALTPVTCPMDKCTVQGPPIPPGSDTLDVGLYYELPMNGAEPMGAHLLAQSTSTASPAVTDQPVTINAGQDNSVSILLYGVPAILPVTVPLVRVRPAVAVLNTFTANSPNTTGVAVPLAVEDFGTNTITGQFSAPVTVTDSDSGTLGTALSLNAGTTTAASETLNSSTDLGNLVAVYGGLAEVAPTITATAPGGITSGLTKPFTIGLLPITIAETPGPSTQTAEEIDLFAPTGTGSSASFMVSEDGWSNPPYNNTFMVGSTGTCNPGTQAATYSLTTTDSLTFTDTAPASPANGSCTVPVTDFTGGQSATETLTYTTTSIIINKKNRLLHH